MPDNLVVLVIDGLQPAMLGPYGNTWVATPAWNRLAAESLLLDRCWLDDFTPRAFAQSAWSGAPLWAGPQAGANVIGELTAAGRRTLLLTDDEDLLDAPAATAFAEQQFVAPGENCEPAADWTATRLANFFAASAATLAEQAAPFAVWLQTRALLDLWDAPYELRTALADPDDPAPPRETLPPVGRAAVDCDPDELLGWRQAYAAQIQALDECLAAFLAAWDEWPAANQTWLLVLSAGGYPLAEHGVWGRATNLPHREFLHFAALLRAPDGLGAGMRSAALALPCDVAATIRELMLEPAANEGSKAESSAELPENIVTCARGCSWVPLLTEPLRELRDRAFIGDSDPAGRPRFCGALTPSWFYHTASPHGAPLPDSEANNENTPLGELYFQPDDYFEVNNVVDRCAAEVAALQTLLADWTARAAAGDFTAPLAELPSELGAEAR